MNTNINKILPLEVAIFINETLKIKLTKVYSLCGIFTFHVKEILDSLIVFEILWARRKENVVSSQQRHGYM